ncbi:MAG: COR domain-containing protein [Ardenticatenaceae bacterium]
MERAELVQRIKQAERERTARLDLSGKGLREVPSEIGTLSNLEVLNLADNQLTVLPPEIGGSTKLEVLDLADNRLTELPSEIGGLTKLEVLNLANNQLTLLPPEIGDLTELRHLYLGRNQLTKVPSQVSQLSLRSLVLSGNKLTTFPVEILTLTRLTSLSLADNQLEELPREIRQLTNLRFLSLAGNQLKEVPPEIGDLTNLASLDLFNNQLTTLPAKIGDLEHLRTLELFNNQLTTLPPELGKLNEVAVSVSGNLHFDIPTDDSRIHDRPETPSKRLNEAKMILVGPANVGKTSLVKRLIEDAYNPPREAKPTEGISIREWSMRINEEKCSLNVWDFGGQDIMYATHEFFLSKRSLYLLVLAPNLAEPEKSLKNWLNMIRNCDDKAPVIVVANKIDQASRLDSAAYQEKYPNVKAFVNTSCKSGEGIGYLKACIQSEIFQLDHMGKLSPESWFAIKSELEQITHHLFYNQYEERCHKQGIKSPQEQQNLLHFLRDLGIVTLKLDPNFEQPLIFNSKWLINGVYKILNHRITKESNGKLQRAELQTILNQPDYLGNMWVHITDMMNSFELCFERKEEGYFLIPDLLSKDKPPFPWETANCLGFVFHYEDLLPKSIISRFIVRMQDHIQSNLVWRGGVILSNHEISDKAWVEANDKNIRVWMKGSEENKAARETFLSTILSHVDHINSTIPGIKVQQLVVWPGWPSSPDSPDSSDWRGYGIPYDELLQLRNNDKFPYYHPTLDKEIDATSLVDSIEQNRNTPTPDNKPDSSKCEKLKEILDKKVEQWVRKLTIILYVFLCIFIIYLSNLSYKWFVNYFNVQNMDASLFVGIVSILLTIISIELTLLYRIVLLIFKKESSLWLFEEWILTNMKKIADKKFNDLLADLNCD